EDPHNRLERPARARVGPDTARTGPRGCRARPARARRGGCRGRRDGRGGSLAGPRRQRRRLHQRGRLRGGTGAGLRGQRPRAAQPGAGLRAARVRPAAREHQLRLRRGGGTALRALRPTAAHKRLRPRQARRRGARHAAHEPLVRRPKRGRLRAGTQLRAHHAACGRGARPAGGQERRVRLAHLRPRSRGGHRRDRRGRRLRALPPDQRRVLLLVRVRVRDLPPRRRRGRGSPRPHLGVPSAGRASRERGPLLPGEPEAPALGRGARGLPGAGGRRQRHGTGPWL
ncbi:MAG: dTDP-4-dehydrorhamnose reductase, partial [uncultured Rubrobacteraceae bacterium]